MSDFFLTGSSGFLGKILDRYLSSSGYTVSNMRMNSAGTDLRTLLQLDQNLISNTVIHAAGRAHFVPKNAEDEKEFYTVNFEGTSKLCTALTKNKMLPKNFVFISSVAVYGVDEGEDIDENHALNGATPYAKSKILAESWLSTWAQENGVTLSILRLPLIAGPNPPGNLGAMINGIKSGRYLRIGRANARKSVVRALDIAQIIPVVAEKGGIYNLTDGYHPSFSELEDAISAALSKKKPVMIPYWCAKNLSIIGDIVGDRFPLNSSKLRKITSTLTFNDDKARKILNWNPSSVINQINEVVSFAK